MSVRMRLTRSKTGMRRSHHQSKLKEPQLIKCLNCEADHLMHRACLSCGFYKNRPISLLISKIERKKHRLNKNNAENNEPENLENKNEIVQ